MLLHVRRGRLADFVGTRHHPRQNADAVREHHQTLGAAFPQFAGEEIRIIFQHVGQGDQVGGVAVHDYAVLAIGRLDALAVGEEVRRQFGCGYRVVRQSPENVVTRAVAVHLHHAEVGFRVQLYVAEKLPGTGDDKRRVGEQRHRLAQGDIARLLVEIGGKWLDIRVVQA